MTSFGAELDWEGGLAEGERALQGGERVGGLALVSRYPQRTGQMQA